MKYYLAYGSNLNKAQMAMRCPDAKPLFSVALRDKTLVFRGNGNGCGVATVEPKEGSVVPSAVWEISDKDEAALDRYEGFPHLYRKETVWLSIAEGSVSTQAMMYVMNPGRPEASPSDSYYETIRQGYKDFDLNVRMLELFAKKGVH